MRTKYTHRRISIIPAANRKAANLTLQRLGMGPDSFSVPVIKGTGKIPTHYLMDAALTPKQSAAVAKLTKVAVRDEGSLKVKDRLSKALKAEALNLKETISLQEKEEATPILRR